MNGPLDAAISEERGKTDSALLQELEERVSRGQISIQGAIASSAERLAVAMGQAPKPSALLATFVLAP